MSRNEYPVAYINANSRLRILKILRRIKPKPVTPGELLREEFLGPMGISQYRLAKEIGVSAPRSAMSGLIAELCVAIGFFKMPATSAFAAAAYTRGPGADIGPAPRGER